MKTARIVLGAGLGLAVVLTGCTGLSYQDRGTNGVKPEPLAHAPIPSFAKYKSAIEAKVVDRRFRTREAMYLANEMNESGFPFFERAAASGLITSDPEFLYLTTVESYWYSRYNMSALISESRLGVHTVFGPYATEWALREGRANVNRNRGEYMRSNKGTMLQDIIPIYLDRTGFPRRFEEASPLMLEFASGDPHYTRPLDKGVKFESTENLVRQKDLERLYGRALIKKPIGMGVGGNDMWKPRINYRENFLTLRWKHAKMQHEIDMGGVGQALVKQALWMEHFFQSSRENGRYLGNDPEQGYRGAMLNLMAVNKMLMLKGALLFDGKKLTGADPREVSPGQVYFPHMIGVRMRFVGDLPPRPEEFSVKDPSSRLFDQASLLWGLSEYYHFADPNNGQPSWNAVFGDNPPYDGSIMEQKYIVLAEALTDLILKNLSVMHKTESGVLASTWTPGAGTGNDVTASDLGMTMLALANVVRRLPGNSHESGLARELLQRQADFVISSMLGSDGRVATRYDFAAGADQGPATLEAQGLIVHGLLEAFSVLGDESYREGALSGYRFMNTGLWDETTGVYRSSEGAETTVYTPLNLGAAIGAMREVILLTGDKTELNRFKRFWIQGIDRSGIQQSEYEETGETDFFAADSDGDGIPRMEYGDGKYGIAPVFASRVEVKTPLAKPVAVSSDEQQ